MRMAGVGIALGVVLIALDGCGGGSVRSAAPGSTSAPVALTSVAFSLTVPRATAQGQRRLLYVSTATQSATIGVSGGGTTLPVVTIACTTNGCSGTLPAPANTLDTFAISLYDGANGTGNLLSTNNAITQFIVANANNTIDATLNPILAAATLTLLPATLLQGPSATSSVTVAALDADGKTIVGPGTFSNAAGGPVTLALSSHDTPTVGSGGTSLSSTTLTAPQTSPITLSYGGAALTSTVVSATVSGSSVTVTPATLTYATPTPSPSPTPTPTPSPSPSPSGTPPLFSGSWAISSGSTNPFANNTPQMYIGLGLGDTIPQGNGFYYVPVAVWTGLAPSGCVPAGSTRVFDSVEVAFNAAAPPIPSGWSVTTYPIYGFLETSLGIIEPDPTIAPVTATMYIEGACTVVATQVTDVMYNAAAGQAIFTYNADAPVSGSATVLPVNGTYVIEWYQ